MLNYQRVIAVVMIVISINNNILHQDNKNDNDDNHNDDNNDNDNNKSMISYHIRLSMKLVFFLPNHPFSIWKMVTLERKVTPLGPRVEPQTSKPHLIDTTSLALQLFCFTSRTCGQRRSFHQAKSRPEDKSH